MLFLVFQFGLRYIVLSRDGLFVFYDSNGFQVFSASNYRHNVTALYLGAVI